MKEVKIGGNTFRLERMSPMTAFNVLRRVSPALVGIGPQLLKLASTETEEEKALTTMSLVFGPGGVQFAQLVSLIPDDHIEFVMRECLSKVTMAESGNWSSVIAAGTAKVAPMNSAILTTPVMVRLLIEVLRQELGDFLAVSNYSRAEETPQTR